MRNTIKAYNNAKELLKQLDLEQKEDFDVSNVFDDTAEYITYVGNENDGFTNFIGVFDCEEGKELCIGDELIYVEQKDIDRLARSKNPAILIELCNKYDYGYPLRTLWGLNQDEEIPVRLKK